MSVFKKPTNPQLISLDLTSRHLELCDVYCQHDYFKDKNWANIEIVPSNETREALKGMHLIFQTTKKGFVLGYRSAPEIPHFSRMNEIIQLTFWLKTNDPAFMNYSDLPYEMTSDIYYFTNRVEKKMDTDQRSLAVYNEVTSEDRVPISGHSFKFEFAETLTDAYVMVENELGQMVFERQFEGDADYININLAGEPPGRYHLYVDHIPEMSFYLMPPAMPRTFGVIDLYFDKSDASNYSFFDANGDTIRQTYNIHLKSRAVKWKYFVVENGNTSQHTDFQVFDSRRNRGDDLVQFDEPEEVIMETNAKAIQISTSEPLPFSESQDEKFKLRTKKGKTKVDWITDLPCASPRNPFKSNPDDKYELYAELLVYL